MIPRITDGSLPSFLQSWTAPLQISQLPARNRTSSFGKTNTLSPLTCTMQSTVGVLCIASGVRRKPGGNERCKMCSPPVFGSIGPMNIGKSPAFGTRGGLSAAHIDSLPTPGSGRDSVSSVVTVLSPLCLTPTMTRRIVCIWWLLDCVPRKRFYSSKLNWLQSLWESLCGLNRSWTEETEPFRIELWAE